MYQHTPKGYKYVEYEDYVEPEKKIVEIDGLSITLFNNDGLWYAFIKDDCPQGYHVSWGQRYPYQAIKQVIKYWRGQDAENHGE